MLRENLGSEERSYDVNALVAYIASSWQQAIGVGPTSPDVVVGAGKRITKFTRSAATLLWPEWK